MDVLSISPMLSIVFGLVLIAFVLLNKSGLGKNRKMRFVLSALLFIYVINSLDYYLTITHQISATYSGTTYIFYHFTGLLLYYFIALYTKSEINIKKWTPIVIIYTLLRIVVFLPFDTVQNLPEFVAALETSNYGFLVLIEYISVSSINIGILFLAFKKIKNAPLIMELNESQGMYYNWIKIMIVAIGLLHVIVFVITIMGSVDMGDFNFYLQFETLIYLVFFFVFTFSVMHFPIFAYTGNFEDLSNTTKHKYAKSSLSNSLDLFQQTKNVVNSEKLYLDFDLKLNTLADKLDKSIHHISQAINQNAKISFPDFINGFRIEEAKKKLLESKPDTILAISLDVGFNSKAAFYTAFKKNTQLTPTEFKKIHKVKKS